MCVCVFDNLLWIVEIDRGSDDVIFYGSKENVEDFLGYLIE